MKIKELRMFCKYLEDIEYIESLCKRYVQVLNADKEDFDCGGGITGSKAKAELERIGKSLRLATVKLEKDLNNRR